jgi:arabinan endo-1,5-alpha-L-arabinosidase
MTRSIFILFLISLCGTEVIFGQKIAAGLNRDGCLELFYINSVNMLCHRYQIEPGEDWSDTEIYVSSVKSVFLGKNLEGSLELFYIDNNNDLFYARQNSTSNDWPEGSLFREGVISICLIANNEGYLQLFSILENNSVRYRKQINSGGTWSAEEDLLPYAERIVAGCNTDGRLEVFYTIAGDVFMHKWQISSEGSWADAAVFAGSAKAMTVAINADGRLEVFFIDIYDHLRHKWQIAPSNGWADDAVFADEAHLICIGTNIDGRFELIFAGSNNVLYHNWQTAPSNGWGVTEQFGWYASDVAIVNSQDQRLEVIYLGIDGLLYHRYQLEPGMFWSSEYPFLPVNDPPFSFEEYYEQPSFTHGPDWHINDHCFIQSDEGVWHMYGIMYPDPGSDDSSYVNYFGHASANQMMQVSWTEESPPFYESLSPGDVLWAPHIVYNEGVYYMFYCGGGELNSYKICLRTSADLVTWSDKQILFQDGYQARDPMVLYIQEIGKWVMYYCATEYSEGGNHIVACRTSSDLYNWSERQVVYRDLHTGTDYGPTESPFVVRRSDYYYLFIGPRPYDYPTETVPNWEHPGYCGTDVFRSANWNGWTNADFVGWIDAHAPEIVRDDDGQWYASHCGVLQGGLFIRRMYWLDGLSSEDITHENPCDSAIFFHNVPNPFESETNIYFTLDNNDHIILEVLDLMGRTVTKLLNENRCMGENHVSWDGTNDLGERVPEGIYLGKIEFSDCQEFIKMLLIR